MSGLRDQPFETPAEYHRFRLMGGDAVGHVDRS
jgi:purine nucleoside phosphorylase